MPLVHTELPAGSLAETSLSRGHATQRPRGTGTARSEVIPVRRDPGLSPTPARKRRLTTTSPVEGLERLALESLAGRHTQRDVVSITSEIVAQLPSQTGWRWAAAVRYLHSGRFAQLLSFVDRDQPVEGFTYAMSIGPCAYTPTVIGVSSFSVQ